MDAAASRESWIRSLPEHVRDRMRSRLAGDAGDGRPGRITPAGRDRELPLSFAQQRLWFLDEFEPGSAEYNSCTSLRLTGELNVPALALALSALVARHESLRTTFDAVDGRGVQIVGEPFRVPVPVAEVPRAPQADRDAIVRSLLRAEVARPFDLRTGPLLRALLLKLDEREHILALTIHHIVTDGWSMGIIGRELSALYDAALRPGAAPGDAQELPERAGLAPQTIQYADFAVWQRDRLAGEELDRQLAYWTGKLDAVAPLELPTDRPRPAVRTSAGAQHLFSLSPETTERLTKAARDRGATLFMAVTALSQLVLSRYSGQSDIAVGTSVSGRDRGEVEGLVGFFVNTLVLREEVDESKPFADFLDSVRETVLEAFAHAEVPFERVVDAVVTDRDMSRPPLVQAMVSLQNTPSEPLRLSGLTLEDYVFAREQSLFDIDFDFWERDGGLLGAVQYNPDLFDAGTVERICGHLRLLADRLTAEPGRPMARIAMLTAEEEHQLLEGWSGARHPLPDTTLPAVYEAQAARTPDETALVCNAVSLTFRELEERANRLAHHLISRSVGPEDLVALALPRTEDMVIGILAVLKAGAAYVPVDPDLPRDRVAFMLADAAPALVLVCGADAASRLGVPSSLPALDLTGAEARELLADCPATAPTDADRRAPLRPAHPAHLIYTSGSTGRPKGVLTDHAGLLNLYRNHEAEFIRPAVEAAGGRRFRAALTAVFSFDTSWEGLLWMVAGHQLHVIDDEVRRDPEAIVGYVRKERIDLLDLTPTYAEQVVAAGLLTGDEHRPAVLMLGGEAVGEALWQQLRSAENAGATIGYNFYGPTEATVDTLWCKLADSPRPVVGRPVHNTGIRVLDRQLRPVPVGVAGELHLSGPQLARGYLGRAGLTAERFIADPYGAPGERMYRTGDLVRWTPDGVIEYLGRADDQVKVRGFRIELGEIESALAAHPDVAQSVVVAREGRAGGKQLVGYVVPQPGAEAPDTAQLRELLSRTLPDYMVPTVVVPLDELPMTSSRKVDRKALPAPDPALFASAAARVAPRTALEETLAGIWMQVLKLDGVGVTDNFFELGGNSILSIQVISRVRKTFGIELSARALFDRPTIAGFAEQVAAGRAAAHTARIAPADRDRALPLSFAQARMWFLDEFEPGNAAYNAGGVLRLSGPLDTGALSAALAALVRRHEVLRTTFDTEDGEAVQRIGEPYDVPVPLAELTATGRAAREAELQATLRAEIAVPFDLRRGPLLRALLVRDGADEHALAVTMHHIVTDGWSMGVVARELGALYDAALECGSRDAAEVLAHSGLAPLSVQYADYAVWQREHLAGAELERQLDFWKGELADVAPLELPTDRPRPPVRGYAGALHTFALSPAATDRLARTAQDHGASLFMAVTALSQLVLARWSGQRDIALGTLSSGRDRGEVEDLIGFFVNTLVLREDVDEHLPFGEFLDLVRESVLAAFAHGEVPFERVVDAVVAERDLSRPPLVQALIAFQNTPAEPMRLHGLRLSEQPLARDFSLFDLTLNYWEEDGALRGSVEYSTDLFDEATIARLTGHLATLAEELTAPGATERPMATLPMLTAPERTRAAADREGARHPVSDATAMDLFEAQAARTPDAPAVVSDGAALTYAELDERANRLARHLVGLGIGPEDVVAVSMPRSAGLLVALYAVLKAGAAYLPVDPGYPAERIAALLADARPACVITQRAAGLLVRLDEGTHHLVLDAPATRTALAAQPGGGLTDADRRAPLRPGNAAYVIYTSGSTGRPKGVVVPHAGLANYLRWCEGSYPGIRGGAILHSSVSFDLTVTTLFAPLIAGGTVYVSDLEDLDPRLWSEAGRPVPTFLKATPSHVGLLESLPAEVLAEGDLVVGGEQLLGESLTAWRSAHPGATVVNEYGPTEATVGCVVHSLTPQDPDPAGAVPIGNPSWNMRAHVLDALLRPVPVGVPGELYVAGAQLARGYLGRPELTAERFVADPSGEPGARMYRTGDLVRWTADGGLEYQGRTDDQVKIRAHRIELGEVEAALAAAPGVGQVCVVAAPGPGGLRLVGYAAPRPGGPAPDAAALKEFAARSLPEYMVPAALVVLPELPLTINGKVDRKALPAPEAAASGPAPAELPATDTQRLLAGIFAELLGVETVGLDDGFFELGGDSILSIQLVARSRRAGLPLTSKEVFRSGTVRALAALVDAAGRAGEEDGVGDGPAAGTPASAAARTAGQAESGAEVSAEAGTSAGPVPLTPVQHWFFDSYRTAPQHYNMSVLLELAPDADPDALTRAVAAVTARHEALRMRFPQDGERVQRPAPGVVPVPLDREDISGVPEEDVARTVDRVVEAAQSSLDLARGPVARAVLFDGGTAHPSRLLLVAHHLVTDAVSLRILLADIEAAYGQARAGEPVRVAPVPTSFTGWAARLSDHVAGGALNAELRYWEGVVEKNSATLPVDAHGANTVSSEAEYTVELTESETEALLRTAPGAYRVRTEALLLTALGATLSEWTGGDGITVDIEGHGRDEIFDDIDLSRTVGWFTTLYPVHLARPTGDDPRARVKEMGRQLRDIPGRGLGYGALRHLAGAPSLTAAATPQVIFNYLGRFDDAPGGGRESGPFASVLPAAAQQSDRSERPHQLDIAGAVSGQQFRLTLRYSTEVHKEKTIADLAERFLHELRTLLG
ncbi:amino acid adenylation domain-containing protein [Streptomyces sp. NPDC101150]|uniref:amino acid adenylation domain-containing protein n=1 Tax=Streptomyces sp. NPDC101150 TaxID=3366114 RepID=UPI003830FA89